MKGLILFIMICLLFGVSCACTKNDSPPMVRERPLELESALIDENYTLFSVQELTMPLAEHSYLLAKKDDTEVKIQQTEEFSQIVKKITSPEDALELVRLIASPEVHPLLSDVYYHEVHEQIEPEDKATTEAELTEQWFAIKPAQYEQWELHEPIVTKEEDGRYKIERFAASYPQIIQEGEKTQTTPAQLLKIWEWVDANGKYTMEIQDVIAEGSDIHKILLFTK